MSIQAKIQEHYKNRRAEITDDHMHIGGKKATAYFAEKMAFKPGQSVLDIGCGMGGPARFVAENYGVTVTGIDLSPDNISAARVLSQGLPVRFDLADGERLPYESGTFDAAMVLHVGMNVPGKAGFYRESARVLNPGGKLGVYDIMSTAETDNLRFPLPWAQNNETSFLESPEAVSDYMQRAGFSIIHTEDRRHFAQEALGNLLSQPALTPPPEHRPIFENLLKNIEEGLCAPYIFIAECLK